MRSGPIRTTRCSTRPSANVLIFSLYTCSKPSLLRRRDRKCHQVVTSVLIPCTFPPGQKSERFYWVGTAVLAVGVEISSSMANLRFLTFFTINLFIRCENGCLPPVFFLAHCNLLRAHPHLSVLAIGSVVATGSATRCCPQCQLLSGCTASTAGFENLERFRLSRLSGKTLACVLKRHMHTHTCIHTLWHTFCFSGGTSVCLFIFSSHPLIPSDTLHSCDLLNSIQLDSPGTSK